MNYFLIIGTLNVVTYKDVIPSVKPLTLTEHYSPEKYPRYDNYEAIEVGKVKKIPCDYYGEMGVPVSFLGKYCPEQFEIIGITSSARWNGKNKYARVMIKKRG